MSQSPEGQAGESFGLVGSVVSSVSASLRVCDTVYNVEVEGNNNYFASGVLLHNCEHLEAVSAGDITRLLINVPPGSMKSLLTNVFWPAWEWGPRNLPSLRYLSFSYSASLTYRDNTRFRQVILGDKYREFWGNHFAQSKENFSTKKLGNTETGWKIASSVGGTGTGERGDRVIVDDPHNVKDAESQAVRESTIQWFTEVLPTRLNDPDSSAIVIIMQRVHEEDVSGLILSRDLDYEHLMIPMRYDPDRHCSTSIGWTDPRSVDRELMWPDRMSPKTLDELENILGPYAAAGQLQQAPTPRGGGILRRDWWQMWPDYQPGESDESRAIRAKSFPPMEYIVASLDGALGEKDINDPSALTIWGVWRNRENLPKIMLMNAWHERLAINPLVEKVAATCKRFKVDRLLIENKASGKSVAQELARLFGNEDWGVTLAEPKGDKVARVYAIQHLLSGERRIDPRTGEEQWVNGLIYAPDREWADMVMDQASTFPRGAHDDLVDTMSQCLKHLRAIGLANVRSEVDRADAAAAANLYQPITSIYPA